MYKLSIFLFFALFIFSCTKDKLTDTDGRVSNSTLLDSSMGGLPGGFIGSSESGSSGSGSTGGTGQGDTTSIEIDPGQITAGEWSDLDNWQYWLDLMNDEEHNQYEEKWEFYLESRYSFKLSDHSGIPLKDAILHTYAIGGEKLWTARSDNYGLVNTFSGPKINAGAEVHRVEVEINDQTFEFFGLDNSGLNELTVPVSAAYQYIADIQFIVDATGSMGDELEYLKVELNDVLERVALGKPYLNIRTSAIYYRDQTDDYLTKVSPFTYDVSETIDFIADQSARGGGDFPEAVDAGLIDGIIQSDWSDQAITRLAFLVLDAPPHNEDQVIENLYEIIEAATAKGIKIIPVTASGIDKSTEFLMRFLSIATNSTYTFITDHSGIGNDHLEPTIGDYEVEYLNDLMERLINKYSEL